MTANDAERLDGKVRDVLAEYDRRIADERDRPWSDSPDARDERLLAVGPETGQLINILAGSLAKPNILELGTSFGYSGIWLAEAARATGGRLTTMEIHRQKSEYAHEMSRKAGLSDWVDFRVGDAVAMITELPAGIDFVLVDLWKDLYEPCLRAFHPKLNPGAIIVADNMLRPIGEGQARYAAAIRSMPDMTSVMVPVGSGLEISVFTPD